MTLKALSYREQVSHIESIAVKGGRLRPCRCKAEMSGAHPMELLTMTETEVLVEMLSGIELLTPKLKKRSPSRIGGLVGNLAKKHWATWFGVKNSGHKLRDGTAGREVITPLIVVRAGY
jgi:hypothetical protein